MHSIENKEEPFKTHTSNWVIYFIFNHKLEELIIVLRYENYAHSRKAEDVEQEHLRMMLLRSLTLTIDDEMSDFDHLNFGALFDDVDDENTIT